MAEKTVSPLNLTKEEVSDLRNLIERTHETGRALADAERTYMRDKNTLENFIHGLHHSRDKSHG